jgi:ASC-1-like (ASCH) protein
MISAEGYERVIPSADSIDTAVAEYDKYYSVEYQHKYGVLAIEVEYVHDSVR